MKKIFLLVIIFCLLSIILIPIMASAQTLVPNPTGQNGAYTICDFFQMLANIYKFIVFDIATPLAVIALVIGGIFMMVSGINPSMMATGKSIMITAIIGLILVFGSWLIINTVLQFLGYTQDWSSFNLTCSG